MFSGFFVGLLLRHAQDGGPVRCLRHTLELHDGRLVRVNRLNSVICVVDIATLYSPTLVANLWDVTDKDIDKFTKATFERTGFHRFQDSPQTETEEILSIPEAVGAARDTCLLRYLNGAAPVVYGIPAWVKL